MNYLKFFNVKFKSLKQIKAKIKKVKELKKLSNKKV